jgi:AraC-like DNA-binding protein
MVIQDLDDRQAVSGDDVLLSEVGHVGWCAPRSAGTYGLNAHRHQGWELCWLRRGAVDWWAGTDVHHVPAGHCYVTQPGELHGGVHSRLTPCDLCWLELSLPRRERWPGLDIATTRMLTHRLRELPHRVFPGSELLSTLWMALLAEHRRNDTDSPLAARGILHQLLAEMLRCSQAHAVTEPSPSPEIAQSIARALERLTEGIGVPGMARAAGLSPSRFHARFLDEVGEPPADWLRRRRIDQAKRLLVTSEHPITELALSLGFPSSQYFATMFKRYVGLTPREYRSSAAAAT